MQNTGGALNAWRGGKAEATRREKLRRDDDRAMPPREEEVLLPPREERVKKLKNQSINLKVCEPLIVLLTNG